jgi:excisionase family DNA binding protein
MSAPPDSNRLLRPEEVGERWAVPVSQVVRLAREGRIPGAVKIGRYWRFRLSALESFEVEGGTPAEDEAAWR